MQPWQGVQTPLSRSEYRPDLSQDQLRALATIPDMPTYGRMFFVTGKAGTGKSTVLRAFVDSTPLKFVVLAPTGLAAINVGGQTMHSFFNFSFGPLDDDVERVPVFKKGGSKHKLINSLDLIVIDEISMVRADVLDAMDFSLRNNLERDEPFGGKTVVAFGDLWQLEPVVPAGAEQEMIEHRYSSPFFFDADVVKETSLDIFELTTVHRQKEDPEFLWALNRLRKGDTSEIDFFNSRVGSPLERESTITLTATNSRANAINMQALSKLSGSPRLYEGKIEGNFGKDFPADPILNLKPGAQVMFCKNGAEWVNGSLGIVTELDDHVVSVRLEDDRTVAVEREQWEKSRYTWDRHSSRIITEPIGTYLQFPLRLAWAVTIHKSQGLTFDAVRIDLDRPGFAHGQVYVALSRCRTLEGLTLRSPLLPRDVVVHPRIWDFEKQVGLGDQA